MKKYEVIDNLGTGNVIGVFNNKYEALQYCDKYSPSDDCYLISEVDESDAPKGLDMRDYIKERKEIDALHELIRETDYVASEVLNLYERLVKELYTAWDDDYSHIGECERCPHNDGYSAGKSGNRKPCGEYRCLVAVSGYDEVME